MPRPTRTFPKRRKGVPAYQPPTRGRTFPKRSSAPTPVKAKPVGLGKTTAFPAKSAPYNPVPKGSDNKRDYDRYLGKPPVRSTTKPAPSRSGGGSRGPSSSASAGLGDQVAAALSLGGGDASKTLALILQQARALSNQSVSPTMTDALMKRLLQQQAPSTRAETEASMAYDSTIEDLKRQIASSESGVGGIMSDLDRYYGVLGKSNTDARAADAAMLAANTDEAGDAARAFMAAAGGSAQEGNTSVAAQASINDANLRELGMAQQAFQGNLGQFFGMAAASQKGAIRGELERGRADLASQLANAQRERGQFKSKLSTDYNDQNLGLALQLKEQLYNQRKDASDTKWNRILGLANLTGMASTLPNEIDQSAINTAKSIEDWKSQILLNEQQRAQLKQFQDTYAGGGEANPFSALDPGSRAKLAGQLMTNLLGPKGYLTVNPNQFLSTLRNRLYNVAGYGQTPQTEQFIQSLLEPRFVNWWNKYHPKQRYTP